MLRFDDFNRLLIVSNKKDYWPGDKLYRVPNFKGLSLLSRKPLLIWGSDQFRYSIFSKKEYQRYEKFELNMFTTCLLQDLQLFRDELFKDCLVVGKFSFVQLDEIKKWKVELCSKPIPRVDVIYNNNEIQVIRSYISPEEYRDKVCLKYMF